MTRKAIRITIKRVKGGWMWVIRDGNMVPVESASRFLTYADAGDSVSMFLREAYNHE